MQFQALLPTIREGQHELGFTGIELSDFDRQT